MKDFVNDKEALEKFLSNHQDRLERIEGIFSAIKTLAIFIGLVGLYYCYCYYYVF